MNCKIALLLVLCNLTVLALPRRVLAQTSAPLISSQPQSQTNNVGTEAVFSVVASGSEPLSYQWYFNFTNVLSDATNSSLTLSNVQPGQAGAYSVLVTNEAGSTMSSLAILTVSMPPFISVQPASLTVAQGQNAMFSVVAGGDRPLTFQWRFNTADLASGANETLTISNAQPGDAGNYQVVVSNAFGSETSAVAVLTVELFDFGDAPPGYPTMLADNGARHLLVPGIYLGSGVDFEPDGQPNSTATGDDLAGINDEDGVSFSGALRVGETADVVVVASTNGLLQGWIDFNHNTNWSDAGEQVFSDRLLVAGTNLLSFHVPSTALVGTTFARFRFSSASGLSFAGAAPDGEVEDYSLSIQPPIDLVVTMIDLPDPVLVGGNVTYVMAITNRSLSPATGMMLIDPLPNRVEFVSASASQGSCTNAAGTTTCHLGSLNMGSHVTVTIVVRTLAPGILTNNATVSAAEFDGNLADNSASQTTACVIAAQTFFNPGAIFIDAILRGPASPYPSTILVSGLTASVYKVTATLSNLNHTFPGDLDILLVGPSGQTVMLMSDAGLDLDAINVTLTFDDAASAAVSRIDQLVSGTFRPTNYPPSETNPAPAPLPPYGATLSVFNGTNPNGAWSLFVADDTSEDGGSIADGWSLSITTIDPISDLAVTQWDAPDPGAIGTNLTYSISLTNYGPADGTAVTLTDLLPSGLTFVSLTNTSGSCINDSGAISCVWNNLANGAGALITIVVQPALGGIFTNTVRVSGQELDLNPSNNIAIAVTPVTPITDLALSISTSPSAILLDQIYAYTLLVTNNGPNAASGVALSNTLPESVAFVSAASSQGSCSNFGNMVTCALSSVNSAASASVTIRCRPTTLGLITNSASVQGQQFDNLPDNNTALIVNTVEPAADVVISMSRTPEPVGLLQSLTYSVVVSNRGPSDASSVSLLDTLPPNVAFGSATSRRGSCSNDLGSVVCDLGSLAVGEVATVALHGVGIGLGIGTNVATIVSSPADPIASNNTAVVLSTVVPAANLVVSQNASPQPVWRGETLTYTIAVSNSGPSDATGVMLRDTPPVSVSLVSVVGSEGSCANQGAAVTCNLGTLANGRQAVVTVVVLGSQAGDITNRASVTANELDLDLLSNWALQVATVITPATVGFNTTPVPIPDFGTALPYPSTILVSGLTAAVQQVRVTLTNLSHTYPDDLDIALVAPNGRAVMLMSDAGGETSLNNVTLRFDDGAALSLPDAGPISSGTFRPTDYEPGDVFPPPAPAGPYATNLSAFNGSDPNGLWSLYVMDDAAKDRGSLGGWNLEIAARDPLADVAIAQTDLPDAVAVGSNILFTVAVSNRGPAVATQVRLTAQLASVFEIHSVTASQGVCSNDNGVVSCELGDLANRNSALVGIALIGTNTGIATSFLSAQAMELDANLSNNLMQIVAAIEVPPAIILQPESRTATNGDTVIFTVAARGAEPLNYQWRRNGVDLAGATNANLVLNAVTPLKAGQYQVRVSNRVGAELSVPATLTVVGPPSISDLADQVIDEDTITPLILFTVGDVESAAETLIVSGSSSNPALIPDANIILGGTGSNRMLRLAPSPNQFGMAVISVRVTDPDGGTTVESFLLTVRPVNDPPVISFVPDQVTAEDVPVVIAFTVDDLETPPDSLVVQAASSNPNLVPNANLALAESGSNRTLIATPLLDQSGSAIITLVVSDQDGATATNRFTLTVTPVNDPPTLAPINNLVIDEDAGPQTVLLTGITAGPTNEIQRIRLSATSSRPALVPNPVVDYVSANDSGTLTFVPVTNGNGTVTITVTVSDGQSENGTFSQSFAVEIRPVNDPPVISDIADHATAEDTPISLPFVVDDDNSTDELVISGDSSNAALVPQGNIVFSGTGANRSVTVMPATNQFGTATITVTVTDTNGASANDSFVLTVMPLNDAPTLDPISDRTASEDAGAQTITLTGIGTGAANEADTLVLTARSSNPALIPNPTVTYTNPNSTASLRFTPAPNATGTAIITVTVDDGQSENSITSHSFAVTVTPVNDPPTISSVADVSTPEERPVTAPFTVSDLETAPFLLAVTASSANTNLVPNANIFVNGATSNRTVTIVPASNQFGTATIALRVSDGIASATSSFVLTVTPVNDPPTLDPLPDITINEGSAQFNVSFGGVSSGATNEAQTLTVTAVSSNAALVAIQSLSYTSPSNVGSVRLRPSASGTGTAVIAITVNDGGASNNVLTRTFTLFVKPATNTPPVISNITDKTTNEDTPIGPIAFTVSDAQTPASALTVRGSSSNSALVPNQNIVFGGSGTNRTVTISPATNQSGSAVITISVVDAQFGMVSDTFVLTVNAVNDPPRISTIPDQSLLEDAFPTIVLFTVDDVEAPAGSLSVSAHSSNSALVPDANLQVGGSGTNRALMISPAANQSGSATISLTVSDGVSNSSTLFVLTVLPVNDPPTISAIPSQVIDEDTATGDILFTVGDLESPAGSLTLAGASSDPTLVPDANIIFTGTGSSRTVRVIPAADQFGTATITVIVSDSDGATASQSFPLSVTPVNDAPALDPIPDIILNQQAGTQTIHLSGIGSGAVNETQTLALSAVSSDQALVPNPIIHHIEGDSDATLTFTPVSSVHGTATISITVNDGQSQNNLLTRSFTVTITEPPTISEIADQMTDEDTPTRAISFTVADLETPATDLSVSGISSNPVLVPEAGLVFGGSGNNRTLILIPATNEFGSTFITVSVRDADGNSVETSFLLTVNPVPDLPIILTQPQSQTVVRGAEVILQVMARGLEPLHYQWQRNGVDLIDQTNPSLILAATQPADAGEYRVVVSTTEGSIISSSAQIRVLSSSLITRIVREGVTIRVSFTTVPGQSYTVEYETALAGGSWSPIATVAGTGDVLAVQDAQATEAMRFYRIRSE